MTTQIPSWLLDILKKTGLEQGNYTFGKITDNVIESVDLTKLPKSFIGIAESEDGNGLAVSQTSPEIVYRFENSQLTVFAINKDEFKLSQARDIAWSELSENMPASAPFWIGIVLKTKTETGEMTLGFSETSRQSAMIIRGRVEKDDMLDDALNRELNETFSLNQYQVIDIFDDDGVVEHDNCLEPLFTVTVEVEQFDVNKYLDDHRISWINQSKPRLKN